MEKRKLKIALSLAVLIPCVLYIAGIIAQFMININAWKAAGSDFSVSPGLPSLELADVFRSMNHYSAQQFDAESIQHLNVDDAFLQEAVDGDYCFVEDAALAPFERWIEKIIIFRWHRTYPADQHFDIDLSGGNWKICESVEFTGHSHERITMEVYLR
mgnify:CR=1 FL=1